VLETLLQCYLVYILLLNSRDGLCPTSLLVIHLVGEPLPFPDPHITLPIYSLRGDSQIIVSTYILFNNLLLDT